MRHSMRLSMLASFGLLSAVLAHADTTSYNFNTGPFSLDGGPTAYGTETTVPQFNESLGTLTSVTIGLSGSYTTSGGTPGSAGVLTVVTYADGPDYLASQDNTSPGTFNFSDSYPTSDPSLLEYFTGTGSSVVGVGFEWEGLPDANSDGFTGTVTYTYTAATVVQATPEPGGLLLLGTGVVGLAGAARRLSV